MASTYSDLKIELIGTGEQTGTWGNTTNTNLGTALGEAITGSADVIFAGSDVTVTLTNTNASQTARNLRLNLTGTSGGARNLILGSGCQIDKLYLINNGLADTVTVKNTTGNGIAVPAGKTMFVFNNGTDVVDAVTYLTSIDTGTINATTVDTTNLEVTNIKAKDGTAAATIANSTGKITVSTELAVDNLNLSGNTISSTDTNGAINLAPNGTGQVVFNAGAVGTPIITTTGDTNTGIFFPAADTIAFTEGGVESMRIDSSGNVGIGTSSPSQKLDVSLAQNNSTLVNVTNTNSGASSRTGFSANSDTVQTNLYATASGYTAVSAWQGAGVLSVGSGSTNGLILNCEGQPIKFSISRTEAMRIDTAGNVGIGTSSPAYDLQVSKTVAAGNVISNINNPSSTGAARLYLGNDFSANAAYFQVFGSSHAVKPSVINIGGNANYPLVFDTNGTERMRITSGGNVLVGKTTDNDTTLGVRITGGIVNSASNADFWNAYSTTASAYRFYVTNAGTVTATSTTISAISDQRLKENVRDLDTGLDAIMSVKPRRFDWKEGKGLDKKDDVGFIAQEFETVFPNSVNTSKAGADGIEYKTVNHGELIPTLVKAIQEQQAMIEELKQEVAKLKGV